MFQLKAEPTTPKKKRCSISYNKFINYNLLLSFLLMFRQPLLPGVVAADSKKSTKTIIKGCNLMNLL